VVKVYLRDENVANGHLIGELPLVGIAVAANELTTRLICEGVTNGDGEMTNVASWRFFCDESDAFVEIVLHWGDES
jgi:hypothetical protein